MHSIKHFSLSPALSLSHSLSRLQTYLKLIKKQQKELNTLKKKHSKVGNCGGAGVSVGRAKRLLLFHAQRVVKAEASSAFHLPP